MKHQQEDDLQLLKKTIIEAIEDKKGENIVSIEVRKIENSICDYFVICNAQSNTQVDAISAGVEKDVRAKIKQKPWHIEGRDNCQWIVMDYVNIIVHIFQTPYREFYKIEDLWADAPLETIE